MAMHVTGDTLLERVKAMAPMLRVYAAEAEAPGCDGGVRSLATHGIWTRSSSPSMVNGITCVGPSIRTRTCSTCSCRAAAIRTRRRRFSARCSRPCSTCHGSSSRIKSRVMARPSGRSCPGSHTASVALCISGVRTPSVRRGSARTTCRGANPLGMRSVSSRPTGPSAQHFRPRRHVFSASA